MLPKGGDKMTVQYNEVQELLRSRADLQARLNLMPYDGTPEIKERGGGKYLYVRKRVANSDMVKDLAHDILLEALKAVSKGKKFTNFYGWYWRMAHNKYANYMEYKKTQTPPCLNNIVVS